MGNSSSKQLRSFKKVPTKSLNQLNLNKLNQNDLSNHTTNNISNKNENIGNDIGELKAEEQVNESFLKKAISLGIVNVEEVNKFGTSNNTNHESLKVLKNRGLIEDEYKDYVNNVKDTKRSLFNSKYLSKLIKEGGNKEDVSDEYNVNEDTFKVLKELVDSKMISLPTYRVVLSNSHPNKSEKEKFVIIEDTEENLKKEQIQNEKMEKLANETPEEFKRSINSLIDEGLQNETKTVHNKKKKVQKLERYL